MLFGQKLNTHRIFKRLAKALIRLRVCAGWSETLLVAHTILLEISCRGSYSVGIFTFMSRILYMLSWDNLEACSIYAPDFILWYLLGKYSYMFFYHFCKFCHCHWCVRLLWLYYLLYDTPTENQAKTFLWSMKNGKLKILFLCYFTRIIGERLIESNFFLIFYLNDIGLSLTKIPPWFNSKQMSRCLKIYILA